jgi:hypothetical protein
LPLLAQQNPLTSVVEVCVAVVTITVARALSLSLSLSLSLWLLIKTTISMRVSTDAFKNSRGGNSPATPPVASSDSWTEVPTTNKRARTKNLKSSTGGINTQSENSRRGSAPNTGKRPGKEDRPFAKKSGDSWGRDNRSNKFSYVHLSTVAVAAWYQSRDVADAHAIVHGCVVLFLLLVLGSALSDSPKAGSFGNSRLSVSTSNILEEKVG